MIIALYKVCAVTVRHTQVPTLVCSTHEAHPQYPLGCAAPMRKILFSCLSFKSLAATTHPHGYFRCVSHVRWVCLTCTVGVHHWYCIFSWVFWVCVMYQSILSVTIPPPRPPPGKFCVKSQGAGLPWDP